MSLDREAYEAYANHTDWKSLATGQPLPQWDKLSPEIQAAWLTSAAWVAGKVSGQHDWKKPTSEKATFERIAAIIETLIGIENLEYHNIGMLSGDNKRRCETKRALLNQCLEMTGCRTDVGSL